MTEKELNKNYIKGIILASKDNEELLVNEIQELCSKQYIRGLQQGKFDATMDMQEQLKQRDEVIDGAINWVIKYTQDWTGDEVEEDMLGLLVILQKYKGDNK